MLKQVYPQRLLVEGNDDLHIIWSLCNQLNINENFNVIDTKGYSNLILRIGAELLQADLKTLGVIVDADLNINSRWQQLKSKFEVLGYDFPENPLPGGAIIIKENKPKIGIWIMPNNVLTGSIEDFIKYLIPSKDDLIPYVDDVLRLINSSGKQRCKEIHFQKSYVSTWLAWQKDPGVPMGQAITSKFLSTSNVEELDIFIKWLKELFS